MTVVNTNVKSMTIEAQQYSFMADNNWLLWLYPLTFINCLILMLFVSQMTVFQATFNTLVILLFLTTFSFIVDSTIKTKYTVHETGNNFVLTSLIGFFFGMFFLMMFGESLGFLTSITALTIFATYYVLIIGVAEESFFRRTFIKSIYTSTFGIRKKQVNLIFMVFISSILFAILHIFSYGLVWEALMFPFVYGILMFTIYVFFKSFMGLVFSHALYDIMVMGENPLILIIMLLVIWYVMKSKSKIRGNVIRVT